jgi:hypothetical protein
VSWTTAAAAARRTAEKDGDVRGGGVEGDAARRRADTSHRLTVSRGGISEFFISKCIGGRV